MVLIPFKLSGWIGLQCISYSFFIGSRTPEISYKG